MQYIQHGPTPIRPADYLLQVKLDSHGLPGYAEQMWVTRLGDFVFKIACVPFMTYGIALGDIIETDENLAFLRVLTRSGRRVLRIAIERTPELSSIHERLHEWVDQTGLSYEWRDLTYLAVDLVPAGEPEPNCAILEELRARGEIACEVDDGTIRPHDS